MDLGSPVGGDCVVLAQLAWDTLQGSIDACGENDELTRELLGLYKILSRLQDEIANPTSSVSRAVNERRRELEEQAADCEGTLKVMNKLLTKYNALPAEEKRRKKLWQRVKFGNGETQDLIEIRALLSAHTSTITMGFNICSFQSPGTVETTLEMAEEIPDRQGGGRPLENIRQSLHWVIAKISADVGEGSVRSSYANEDKTFWRTLRRELVTMGYDNYALQKHRRLIKAYVEELVNRGVLDQGDDNERYIHSPRPRLQRVRSNFYLQGPSRIDTRSPSPLKHVRSPSPKTSPRVLEDVTMTDVPPREDRFTEQHSFPAVIDPTQAVGPQAENAEDSDLSASTLVEDVYDSLDPSLVKQNPDPKSFYAAQIEEVIDEEFVRFQKGGFEERPISELFNLAMDVDDMHDPGDLTDVENDDNVQEAAEPTKEAVRKPIILPWIEGKILSGKTPILQRRPPVQIEEILDDDFTPDAHPNVYLDGESIEPRNTDLEERPPVIEIQAPEFVTLSSRGSKQPSRKSVRWAENDEESSTAEQRSCPCTYSPEELPFIFHREFRDFDVYTELQESSQALIEEQKAGTSRRKRSDPSSRTCSFVTQNAYIPPATLWDLQYYRIPASYFHKFWHPGRVPMYLHGNVFDGVSFTDWLYNWTAYTYRDDSFEMSTVRRFGKQVIKLGSAMTDMENADDSIKRKLPRDLYDESGTLWEDLENIVNDIMSDAENRLEKRGRGRLEVEFTKLFCREMIHGDLYYRPIEKFVDQTNEWCSKVRFHKDFVMLWNLWAA